MHRLEEAVELTMRHQVVSQNERVEAVVLSSRHGEAIPEPIELLRIDSMHKETRVHQTLKKRAGRNLDPDGDAVPLTVRRRPDPVRQLHPSLAAMRKQGMAQLA